MSPAIHLTQKQREMAKDGNIVKVERWSRYIEDFLPVIRIEMFMDDGKPYTYTLQCSSEKNADEIEADLADLFKNVKGFKDAFRQRHS